MFETNRLIKAIPCRDDTFWISKQQDGCGPRQLPNQSGGEVAPAASPGGGAARAAAQVTIRTLKYSPETIEIKRGETVEWQNNDLTPHTGTSQSGNELNSEAVEPDATWSHTFSQPGTFPYYCTFHTEMKGTVIVK